MHGQEQTSPLLSRDCAFVSEEPVQSNTNPTMASQHRLVDPPSNTNTTTHHHPIITNNDHHLMMMDSNSVPLASSSQVVAGVSSSSSSTLGFSHQYSRIPTTTTSIGDNSSTSRGGSTMLLPSATSLYERDHSIVVTNSSTTNTTIPSLSSLNNINNNNHSQQQQQYNNQLYTQHNNPSQPSAVVNTNLEPPTVGSRLEDVVGGGHPQQQQQGYPTSSSSSIPPPTITTTTTTSYYPMSSSGSSVMQQDNTNNYYHGNPKATTTSPFPYPSSSSPTTSSQEIRSVPHHHQQPQPYHVETTRTQMIRTHASSTPSPSSMMLMSHQQSPAATSSQNAHSPIGIISRSSAYPPLSNTHQQQAPQHHHHLPPPPPTSQYATSSNELNGYGHSGGHYASHVSYPPLSNSTRPVPSYHSRHLSEVDTIPRPSMESQPNSMEQNIYSQERNSKNPMVKHSKLVEHKSCIICGKADTGNKYISYTINESNIEQYKGCFRHVPEIRIGDGVCKNCYAKKYKYVTGLSINKVKRKNNVKVSVQDSSPISQQPPPSPHGHQHHTPTTHVSSHASSPHHRGPTSTNTITTSNVVVSSHHQPPQYASHHGGYHVSSSAPMLHPHEGRSVHVQPPSHHHHDMHAPQHNYEDYPVGTSNATTRVKYYPHDNMQSPPQHYASVHDGPMHAHYSSSYSSTHPHQNAPPTSYYQSSSGGSNHHNRSPPVSPTNIHANSSYRKSHHYHPYASSENSQYLNGPNSTSSGGSNSGGGGGPRGGVISQPSPTAAMHDPFVRSSLMQHPYSTSPKSPSRNNGTTPVPSIMEMMGTAPPSYAIGSNQPVNNNSSSVNRNYTSSPLNAFNNGQNKHENAALPRIESASPLSSHRYHPYGSSNVHRNQTTPSGREDSMHSTRLYTPEHSQNSPNPSPIRVASIVATGPALPGNAHAASHSNSHSSYSPPPIVTIANTSNERQEEAKTSLPDISNIQPPISVKQEDATETMPKITVKMETEVLEKLECENTALAAAFQIVKEEDRNILKEKIVEPTVNVFLTFVSTSGTQSPTTRLSIPKSIGLTELKDLIQRRLQKNSEEESNSLQIGDEMNLGNIMLKKDENNFVEIDEQFCAVYRFEHHDSLKISLIK